MKKIIYFFAMALLLAACAGSKKSGSNKAPGFINQWMKNGEWSGGLTLTPHPSVNKIAFYTAYNDHKSWWDAAFKFLKENNLDTLSPGRYPIIGDTVFASITEAPSHEKDEVKWESHRIYVDLQFIIKGKELIGIAPVETAVVTKPYTVDVVNYTATGTYVESEPGKFFLFFPTDAHRPTIKIDGYPIVKKIVIKIKLDN
jgi:biofilm protein TabA